MAVDTGASEEVLELAKSFEDHASLYVYARKGGRQFSAWVYLQAGKLRRWCGKARLSRAEAIEIARELYPFVEGPSKLQCEILITADALAGKRGRHEVPESILEARKMLAREAKRLNEEKAPAEADAGLIAKRVQAVIEELEDD